MTKIINVVLQGTEGHAEVEGSHRVSFTVGEAAGRRYLSSLTVHAPSDGRVSAALMRDTPVARLEAILNSPVGVDDNAFPDARSYRLRGARSRPKPVGFHERLAHVYLAAMQQTRRPAQKIASANGVPVTTVHGWVKEARRQGHLPPGQR